MYNALPGTISTQNFLNNLDILETIKTVISNDQTNLIVDKLLGNKVQVIKLKKDTNLSQIIQQVAYEVSFNQ